MNCSRFKDKSGADLCLSPTNEEAVSDIFRKSVKSYKQLPLNLYQINTKFRDELRPRFGLMRAREFVMKDAYSFDIDRASMDASYQAMYRAYCTVFERCGLTFVAVEADAGNMAGGDSQTHEFQVLADTGEDQIVYGPKSGYAANREKAETLREVPDFDFEKMPLQTVSTPGMDTIKKVCDFLGKPPHHSLKALVYAHGEEIVLLQLLGDDELSETKLKNYLGGGQVAPATDAQLERNGLPKGYIGAAEMKHPVRTIFDRAVNLDASYVAGACQKDTHFQGVVPSRDVTDFEVADLRLAREGDLSPQGQDKVVIKRGIEVGHIFQLGDLYSKALKVSVLDKNGRAVAPLMGCYGIGVTRIIAAVIEQHHDDKGIVWPKNIAPYDLSLVVVGKSESIKKKGEEIYHSLQAAGLDVLYDDRDAGAGFKFKDAELLGLPLTVVLGEKTFNSSGELEIIERKGLQKTLAHESQLASKVCELHRMAF